MHVLVVMVSILRLSRMSSRFFSEKEVQRLAKETQHKKTPHSVEGVSVTHRTVSRDSSSGKFIVSAAKTTKTKN